MNNNLHGFPKGEGYFDQLPKLQQIMIERMVQNAFDDEITVEVYGDIEPKQIECRSRDGFIPFSHNKGGVEVSGFTDLMGLWGSGYMPSNPKASDKIQAIIDSSLQTATEQFFEDNRAELEAIGITTIAQCNYHDLYDSGHGGLAEKLSEYENEHLSGDYSSVQYQLRAMYHGKDARGVHSMTVFAFLSASDAPYHRSSDATGEVLITWKTGKALKRKLAKALEEAARGAF